MDRHQLEFDSSHPYLARSEAEQERYTLPLSFFAESTEEGLNFRLCPARGRKVRYIRIAAAQGTMISKGEDSP